MSRNTDGSGMKPRRVGCAVARQLLAGDAAGEQQLIDQIVGLEAGVAIVRRAAPPAPGLAQDRARHAADKGRGHQHRPTLGAAGQKGIRPRKSLWKTRRDAVSHLRRDRAKLCGNVRSRWKGRARLPRQKRSLDLRRPAGSARSWRTDDAAGRSHAEGERRVAGGVVVPASTLSRLTRSGGDRADI